MKILVLSPEAGDWAEPSPLSRVVDAISLAYRKSGAEVRVMSPLYPHRHSSSDSLRAVYQGTEQVQGMSYEMQASSDGLHFYVKNPVYFERNGVYYDENHVPYADNHCRFAYLAATVLDFCTATGWIPDRIHCHEWGASFLAAYAKRQYCEDFATVPVHFTIHNIAYDFHMFESEIERVGLDRDDYGIDGYEFWGKVSLLKVGILYADKVVFTSKGYRDSLLQSDLPGGLQGFLEYNSEKVIGIQNGIDYGFWIGKLADKKRIKQEFQAKHKLSEGSFLLGCVLTPESGKTAQTISTLLSNLFNSNIQLAVVVHPNLKERDYFERTAQQNSERMVVVETTKESVLRDFLEASDGFFLADPEEPSNSLVLKALAVGAVPVASAGHGVADRILHFDGTNGQYANGFLAPEPWPDSMLRALRYGLEVYSEQPEIWESLVRNCSTSSQSWEDTARDYLSL